MTPLFHWLILLQDVPESEARVGERAVIVDELPFSEVHQETGYTIKAFRQVRSHSNFGSSNPLTVALP